MPSRGTGAGRTTLAARCRPVQHRLIIGIGMGDESVGVFVHQRQWNIWRVL